MPFLVDSQAAIAKTWINTLYKCVDYISWEIVPLWKLLKFERLPKQCFVEPSLWPEGLHLLFHHVQLLHKYRPLSAVKINTSSSDFYPTKKLFQSLIWVLMILSLWQRGCPTCFASTQDNELESYADGVNMNSRFGTCYKNNSSHQDFERMDNAGLLQRWWQTTTRRLWP